MSNSIISLLEKTDPYTAAILGILWVSSKRWYPIIEQVLLQKVLKKTPSAHNHPGIVKLKGYNLEVNSMEISSHSAKSKMMRDCLRTIINVLEDGCKTFVEDKENYNKQSIVLQNKMSNLLINMSSKFSEDLKRMYLKQGLNYEDTNIIIKSISHSRSVSRTVIKQEIETVFSSGYYNNNNSMIVATITAISISTGWLLDSIYDDFVKMNGSFDKYTYDHVNNKFLKSDI